MCQRIASRNPLHLSPSVVRRSLWYVLNIIGHEWYYIKQGAGALGDIDWCLKSKIRITSEHDFEWMNVNELHYEARALATLHQNKTETMVS